MVTNDECHLSDVIIIKKKKINLAKAVAVAIRVATAVSEFLASANENRRQITLCVKYDDSVAIIIIVAVLYSV